MSSENANIFEVTILEFAWNTRKTDYLQIWPLGSKSEPRSSDRKSWLLTNEQWHSVSCMLGTTWRMAWQLLCEFAMMLGSLSFVYLESCLKTPFSSVLAVVGLVYPRSFHSSCYPVSVFVCVCVCVRVHPHAGMWTFVKNRGDC